MSSGNEGEAEGGIDVAEAAGGKDSAATERDDGRAAGAMTEAVEPAAAEAYGRARAGALAAMEAAAAIGHGGLAAGTAGTGASAAAGRGQVVADRVAVAETAAGLAGGGVQLGAGWRCGRSHRLGHSGKLQPGWIDAPPAQSFGPIAYRAETPRQPRRKTGHLAAGLHPGEGMSGTQFALQDVRLMQKMPGHRRSPHEQHMGLINFGVWHVND